MEWKEIRFGFSLLVHPEVYILKGFTPLFMITKTFHSNSEMVLFIHLTIDIRNVFFVCVCVKSNFKPRNKINFERTRAAIEITLLDRMINLL